LQGAAGLDVDIGGTLNIETDLIVLGETELRSFLNVMRLEMLMISEGGGAHGVRGLIVSEGGGLMRGKGQRQSCWLRFLERGN